MEQQQQEPVLGFNEKPYQCNYCENRYKTTESRANHHKLKHERLHEKWKYHKKVPKYPCKHCFVGFGNRHSKWRHEQRCECNPEIVEWLKKMKKINKKLKKEEEKEQIEENYQEGNGECRQDEKERDKNEEN